MEEEIVGEYYAEIKSVYPDAENASAVIVVGSCGGNRTASLILHRYLIVPEEHFLRTYYIGTVAHDISVILDSNNKIANIQADVCIGKDKYLTLQYKTCRFLEGVSFVDPKTNSSCCPERDSDIYEIDFF